jgi:hypothetical protein
LKEGRKGKGKEGKSDITGGRKRTEGHKRRKDGKKEGRKEGRQGDEGRCREMKGGRHINEGTKEQT